MICLRTDSTVLTLSTAVLALLRADFSMKPVMMFTTNKTAITARIRPKPAYSFFPIVIADCLHSPRPRRQRQAAAAQELLCRSRLLGAVKLAFRNLRGFFRGGYELPILYGVLARLDEQRMPANHA